MSNENPTRWSKSEMELIRNTFSGEGLEILYKIRNVFLQLSDDVPALSEDVLKIIKKLLLPDLDAELPIGFQADIRNALAGNQQAGIPGIKDFHPEIALKHIEANDLVIDYLEQQFNMLKGGYVKQIIKLKDLKSKENKTKEERYVSMLAYLFLENAYIDGSLNALKDLANSKELTEEELKEKAKKNSSK